MPDNKAPQYIDLSDPELTTPLDGYPKLRGDWALVSSQISSEINRRIAQRIEDGEEKEVVVESVRESIINILSTNHPEVLLTLFSPPDQPKARTMPQPRPRIRRSPLDIRGTNGISARWSQKEDVA